MKASAWLFSAAMSVCCLASAQTAMNPGVTEITDPAKIAEIERHAQELASSPPATPTVGERKHSMRHHKDKTTHQRAKKDKAPSDTPMATDSKK